LILVLMVSCRYLRNVKQQMDMLISLRYLQDNWFYLGQHLIVNHMETYKDSECGEHNNTFEGSVIL
jgi:hypothetical protein